MAEQEPTTNTGGGTHVAGDVGTQGGKFVGRDDGSTTGNILNVTIPAWGPPPVQHQYEDRDAAYRYADRGLSVTAEESLRNDIRELRTVIGDLAKTVGSLDKTLTVEVDGATNRLDSMQKLVDSIIADRQSERPVFDSRTSTMLVLIGFMILVLLGIIAWASFSRNIASAQVGVLSFTSIAAWIFTIRGKLT